MTERWGDRDVSEDTGLVVDRLDALIAVLERIAVALEKPAQPREQSLTAAYNASVEWLKRHDNTTVPPRFVDRPARREADEVEPPTC